jgi:hypothetical protein
MLDAVAVVAVIALAGCGRMAHTATHPAASTSVTEPARPTTPAVITVTEQLGPKTAALRAPTCASNAIRLALTSPISPATDEGGRNFALRNISGRSCLLDGSPRIVLYDHGHPLPFIYHYDIERGGGLDIPSRLRRPALLLPATSAYFSVTKAECVGPRSGEASAMRAFLPGGSAPLDIALPAGEGVSAIGYCLALPGERYPAPGNSTRVSPIERSPPACVHEVESPRETEQEIEKRGRRCEAEDRETVESYRRPGAGRPRWEVK